MKEITSSKEDYLRVLLELSKNEQNIHLKDVAEALGITRASVSRMMGILMESGYIIKEKYGAVSLTNNGRNVAIRITKRRKLIKKFLTDILGVETVTAESDACRMEHAISKETAEKLSQQLKRLSNCEKVKVC